MTHTDPAPVGPVGAVGHVGPVGHVGTDGPVGPEDLAALDRDLPARARRAITHGGHRDLGRVVRDAVLLLLSEPSDAAAARALSAAHSALDRLAELQGPSGTFRGGDNVDSPPDTAFTVNDLAWARVALSRAEAPSADGSEADGPAADARQPLRAPLDAILEAVAPALVTGGVHTPNHRWEIASALARLWEAQGVQGRAEDDPCRLAVRRRAEQWLAEGVDLQADGMFSERSANYAAHVSVPSLLTLGRILGRPELIADADRATRVQAQLTGSDGLVETLASRRQDQFAPFDGGALHPLFRAHAARTGDPLTSRAAHRTAARADAHARLTLAAMAVEDPAVLGPLPVPADDPLPSSPDVVELADSGLVRVDHGTSSAVLLGGTDTAALGRVVSGASSRPTLLRLRGSSIGVRDLRLSRDFFNLGPLRPGPPHRTAAPQGRFAYALEEEVGAGYYQPLAPSDLSRDGRYDLEFEGRFAAAMAFSRRVADRVSLRTSMRVEVGPGEVTLRIAVDGPTTPICLLLALEGGRFTTEPALRIDDRGRRILDVPDGPDVPDGFDGFDGADEPGSDPSGAGRSSSSCSYTGVDERLEITASGALGGRAFYAPGEAYAFLGATDEPDGDVLLVPASTSAPLSVQLRLGPAPAD